MRLLRSLAIDVGPLRRHREFRLLYIGQGVSFAGSMITYVAIPFQVYELTGSTLVVGLLGIVELVPLLVTALLGGALADAHDRRRMVLLADTVLLLLSLVLVANALLGTLGLGATYAIDAATFLVSLAALAGMRAVPPPPEGAPPSVARIREGW